MGVGDTPAAGAFAGKIGKTIKDSAPHWPPGPKPPAGAPNILVVLFDDVGFSDFGCYGSPIATPTIDAIAARGLRYTGFHTTAMCSTTRAALLTGRNHHSVGVGCLANFDQRLSGLSRQDRARGRHPGRDAAPARLSQLHAGQVARDAAHRDRRHRPVRRLAARPRLRPLLRLHGCRDRPVRARARARQHADRSAGHLRQPAITSPPISSTRSIRYHRRSRRRQRRKRPGCTWLALGACHAPHQAPRRPDPEIRRGVRRTAGMSSASSGWPARSRWASCPRARACRRATTACSPGTTLSADEQRAVHAACRRPTPPCSTMPTSTSRG